MSLEDLMLIGEASMRYAEARGKLPEEFSGPEDIPAVQAHNLALLDLVSTILRVTGAAA